MGFAGHIKIGIDSAEGRKHETAGRRRHARQILEARQQIAQEPGLLFGGCILLGRQLDLSGQHLFRTEPQIHVPLHKKAAHQQARARQQHQ